VRDIAFDCDGDTLLIKVDQIGAACHEGYRSCFFRSLRRGRRDGSRDGAAPANARGDLRQEMTGDTLPFASREYFCFVFRCCSSRAGWIS
jgi:hypothetical protein